jgi:hypothetical protein
MSTCNQKLFLRVTGSNSPDPCFQGEMRVWEEGEEEMRGQEEGERGWGEEVRWERGKRRGRYLRGELAPTKNPGSATA